MLLLLKIKRLQIEPVAELSLPLAESVNPELLELSLWVLGPSGHTTV